jgi:hypothetical protein
VTRPCPPPEELLALLDGELTENRAAALRGHAAACPRCAPALEAERTLLARLAADVPGVPSPETVEEVLRRAPEARPARRSRRARWAWPAAASVAAAILALVWLPREAPGPDAGTFTPRGGGVPSGMARDVGVRLWALDGAAPRALDAGGRVAAGTPLVATAANAGAAPAYLLAFAVDSAGEIRWIHPAWTEPGAAPESVRLDPGAAPQAQPEAVAFDDLPQGPLRVLLVVSPAPLRASDIEGRPAAALAPAPLRERFPAARVEELLLAVEAPAPSRP